MADVADGGRRWLGDFVEAVGWNMILLETRLADRPLHSPSVSACCGFPVSCIIDVDRNEKLFGAAQQGDLTSVRQLVKDGADPDAGIDGEPSLCVTDLDAHPEIAAELIEAGASLAPECDGETKPIWQRAHDGRIRKQLKAVVEAKEPKERNAALQILRTATPAAR